MNLSINYEETRSIGNQLIAKAQDYNSLIGTITNVNSEIRNYWNGSDADKYFQAIEIQIKYMRDLASIIDEIGRYLIKVSNAYEQASANNEARVHFN